MEEKFTKLKAALQQAKEACEISLENKKFQQEYELAKQALKQAQKEVCEGKTLYLFVISLYTLLSFLLLLTAASKQGGLDKKISMAAKLPMLFIKEIA